MKALRKPVVTLLLLAAFLFLTACRSTPVPTTPTGVSAAPALATEQAVTVIPLTGPLADRDAEVSGLAWYGDYLILLPQYPGRLSTQDEGAVFALPRADIVAFLDGAVSGPLEPVEVPLVAPGLVQQVQGFEGYEAIAFIGDSAFLTIEASPGGSMQGYLVAGAMLPDLSELRLDFSTLAEISPQADLSNMTDESLLVAGDVLVTVYEANGAAVNPDPVAHLFDQALVSLGTVPFPSVEYRITDATALDSTGRFWAINYFWPGDTQLSPGPDPLLAEFGAGPTHAQFVTVERLVEFQYDDTGITLAGTPPIQLELIDDDHARNWEGVVCLDERGFLLVTDRYPETMLGFVPGP